MAVLTKAVACAAVQVMVLTLPVSGAFGWSAAQVAACAGDAVIPNEAQTRRQATDAVLCLVNAKRGHHGLRPLKRSRLLSRAAVSHSEDMVRRKYFAHVSPTGVGLEKRVARTGYLRHASGVQLGEAIAFGADATATPRELVADLMGSGRHRALILTRRLRDIGVGLALGAPMDVAGAAGVTLSLTFGRR